MHIRIQEAFYNADPSELVPTAYLHEWSQYFYSSLLDIESEKDFPPEYLSNVTRKEETCRSQLARIGRPLTSPRVKKNWHLIKKMKKKLMGIFS